MNSKASTQKRNAAAKPVRAKKLKQQFPPGWNEAKVRQVIAHYENQTEDEALAEDEAARHAAEHTLMYVPKALVPAVRRLIARHQRQP